MQRASGSPRIRKGKFNLRKKILQTRKGRRSIWGGGIRRLAFQGGKEFRVLGREMGDGL